MKKELLEKLKLEKENPSCIIVTTDKDLNNTPGWHWNWVTRTRYFIGGYEANRRFYHQLITGDSTDNIVGIPGVGKVGADKILAEEDDTEKEILCKIAIAYAVAYDDPESAMLENGRLLWIRRNENELWDFDYATK